MGETGQEKEMGEGEETGQEKVEEVEETGQEEVTEASYFVLSWLLISSCSSSLSCCACLLTRYAAASSYTHTRTHKLERRLK